MCVCPSVCVCVSLYVCMCSCCHLYVLVTAAYSAVRTFAAFIGVSAAVCDANVLAFAQVGNCALNATTSGPPLPTLPLSNVSNSIVYLIQLICCTHFSRFSISFNFSRVRALNFKFIAACTNMFINLAFKQLTEGEGGV